MAITHDAVEERRNFFLIFAAFIANVYLFAFGLDAGLSLADEVLQTAGSNALTMPREIVAGIVSLASFVVMPLLLLFVPHIPRRIFLPLVIFALWVGFGAPPLMLVAHSTVILGLAVAQVALALYAFWMTSRMMDGTPWLRASLLPRKSFLVLRTIAAIVSAFLFLAIAMPILMIGGVAGYLETQSKGYVDFTGEGVDLQETVLENGTQKVRLIAMMHIGEPQFYRDLFSTFPAGSLVLSEGVSDRENRLAGNFSYQRVAETLGLSRQPQLSAAGAVVEEGSAPQATTPQQQADPQTAEPVEQPLAPAAKTTPEVVRADIDVSELSDVTVRILTKVGELYASDSLGQALTRYMEMTSTFTEEDFKVFFGDVVDKRNAHVLAEFDKRRANYDTIIIPWGGLHMPGLEQALIDRGFKIVSQEKRQIVKYQTIVDRMNKPQA